MQKNHQKTFAILFMLFFCFQCAVAQSNDGNTPIPMYRYGAENRFIFDANPNLGQGWSNLGIEFYLYVKPVTGADLLYVHEIHNPYRRIFSWNKSPNPGYTFSGQFYYAFKVPAFGTAPVYAYFSSNPDRFSYATEIYAPGWVYKGVAFHAPQPAVQMHKYGADGFARFIFDDDPNIKSGWTKVDNDFRFYRFPVHGTSPLYVSDASNTHRRVFTWTKNSGVPGYNPTGVAYFAYKEHFPGTVPIYQYSMENPKRFSYGTTPNAPPWKSDGVAFYVPEKEFFNKKTLDETWSLNIPVPMYKYMADGNSRFIFDPNPTLKQGWENLGQDFFVFTKPGPGLFPIHESDAHNPFRKVFTWNLNSGVPGFNFTGNVYYVYKTAVPGTLPIYQYNQINPTRFSYSTEPNAPHWINKGIQFYTPENGKPFDPKGFVSLYNPWRNSFTTITQSGTLTIDTSRNNGNAMWLEEFVDPQTVRLRHWLSGKYLHCENGSLAVGTIQQDWKGALWEITNVPNLNYSNIKNKKTNTFLSTTGPAGNKLQLINETFFAASWIIMSFDSEIPNSNKGPFYNFFNIRKSEFIREPGNNDQKFSTVNGGDIQSHWYMLPSQENFFYIFNRKTGNFIREGEPFIIFHSGSTGEDGIGNIQWYREINKEKNTFQIIGRAGRGYLCMDQNGRLYPSKEPNEFSDWLITDAISPVNTEGLNQLNSRVPFKIPEPEKGLKIVSGSPGLEVDFCWRDSYGRGVGTIPDACPNGMEMDGGLCYKKCESGYKGVGPVCWSDCPSNFTDIGAACSKPPSYGRGGGFPWQPGDGFNLNNAYKRCRNSTGGECETSGAIVYPKCKPGFYAFGCCICSPNCLNGMADAGAWCWKKSYGRGVGIIPICAGGKENNAGLCYEKCKAGYDGVGPVCWMNNCPVGVPVKCGMACAQTGLRCANETTNQVVSSLTLVSNILTVAGVGPAAYVPAKTLKKLNKAKNVSLWVLDRSARVEAIFLKLKNEAEAKGEKLDDNKLKTLRDLAIIFAEAEANEQTEFDFEDIDPSGLVAVIKAYTKPLCKDVGKN